MTEALTQVEYISFLERKVSGLKAANTRLKKELGEQKLLSFTDAKASIEELRMRVEFLEKYLEVK